MSTLKVHVSNVQLCTTTSSHYFILRRMLYLVQHFKLFMYTKSIDQRFWTRYWLTMSKHRVNSKHCQDGQKPDDKGTRTNNKVTSWVITSSSMSRCHSFLSFDWSAIGRVASYWVIIPEGQSEICCHNSMSTICLCHRQSRGIFIWTRKIFT